MRFGKTALPAICLTILISTSSAVNVAACTSNTLNELLRSSIGGLLGVLALLVVFSLAVLYSLSYAFNRQEYLVLAKDEMFHLGMSFLVLLFFGTVMGLSCGLVGSAFDFAYGSVHDASRSPAADSCYLQYRDGTVQQISACYVRTMESDAKQLINVYTKANIDLQLEASAYVSYYGLKGGMTFAPKAYKRSQAMFVDNVNTIFVLPAYVSIAAQDILMRFFISSGTADENGNSTGASAVLGFILPGAFVLRFFPPTRQVGNMLIAASAGLYLVVPFFIALNGIMYQYTFSPSDCSEYSGVVREPIASMGDCTPQGSTPPAPGNLLAVARLYPQAFLLPNLVIVVFITFVSSINKALKVLG